MQGDAQQLPFTVDAQRRALAQDVGGQIQFGHAADGEGAGRFHGEEILTADVLVVGGIDVASPQWKAHLTAMDR